MSQDESPGFWSRVWQYMKAIASSLWKWLLRYPVLIPVTILLITLAVFGILIGQKIQIGGILGKLWGKKPKDNKRAVPPEDRVDEDGKPIQPGESDDKGYVQAPVKTNIKDPGIFSDPNEVVIEDPDEGDVVIVLPKGVKNSDVKEVIRIKPKVYEVKNNDGGTSVHELDSIIDELGG
jgi:hypothetical protein